MKNLLILLMFAFATLATNAQCISAVTFDTTANTTTIRFTKTSAVKKVALFYSVKSDADTTTQPKMTPFYTTSPIILTDQNIAPGDTFNARIKGYFAADSVICTTNNFTFKTPHYTVDSCSTPTGLKAWVGGGKAYLAWTSGFSATYTLKVTEVGGSTTTYSSLTVCQKAVAVKPGKTYTWFVTTSCTPTRYSETATFQTTFSPLNH
jgi:hypothetical protein